MGRLFCLLRISFFSGMGRHNNVINAAFPFPVFFFSGGKINDAWMNKEGLRAVCLLAQNAL